MDQKLPSQRQHPSDAGVVLQSKMKLWDSCYWSKLAAVVVDDYVGNRKKMIQQSHRTDDPTSDSLLDGDDVTIQMKTE